MKPAVIIGISVGASVVAVFAVLAGIEQYAFESKVEKQTELFFQEYEEFRVAYETQKKICNFQYAEEDKPWCFSELEKDNLDYLSKLHAKYPLVP